MSTTIHFPDDFLLHIDMWRVKGFAVLAVTHNGLAYRLSFFDLGNIAQGLKGEGEEAGYFAEPGMVAVQEISESSIRGAVSQLAKRAYFESLVPIGGFR